MQERLCSRESCFAWRPIEAFEGSIENVYDKK
jgi:hypothetical protein